MEHISTMVYMDERRDSDLAYALSVASDTVSFLCKGGYTGIAGLMVDLMVESIYETILVCMNSTSYERQSDKQRSKRSIDEMFRKCRNTG